MAGREGPTSCRRGALLHRSPHPQRPSRPHGCLDRLLEKLFNFRQIRFFDIEGRASGLFSRALTSRTADPDPINEDAGDSGQIEEYLNIYRARASSTSLRRARYLR